MTGRTERTHTTVRRRLGELAASAAQRARSNRLVLWVLFWGRRSSVSLALLGVVFATVLGFML